MENLNCGLGNVLQEGVHLLGRIKGVKVLKRQLAVRGTQQERWERRLKEREHCGGPQ